MQTNFSYYWNNLKIQNRHYQFNIKLFKEGKRIKSKTKFFKKIVKKSKTMRLNKIFKLNLLFNIFTVSPPLSTFLNLIGLNSQNFIEDLNKNFSNILHLNIPVILSIFINLDLSYNFTLNLNYNYLIKNFTYLNILSSYNLSNMVNLNFLKKKINILLTKNNLSRIENENFLYRYFFNSDIFFLIYFLFYHQQLFFNMNLFKNSLSTFYKFPLLIEFESFVSMILSVIKSYNVYFNKNKNQLLKKKYE